MVLKLAGKFFMFGLLWWSSIHAYRNPNLTKLPEFLRISHVIDSVILVQILAILYFLIITLGFLEVRVAVWGIIIKLIYSIYFFNDKYTTLNNLVLISGLLLYYNKITQIKPLVIHKKT